MLCLLVSCKDTDNSGGSDNQKNKDRIKVIYTALETGDMSKLDSIIDKDVIDHQNNDAKSIDTMKKFFSELHNNVTGLKIEQIANATDGDYNLDFNHTSGDVTAPVMGMSAGAKLDFLGVDICKIKDGKITEHWGFIDPAAMMKMMSAPPKMEEKKDTSKKM